MTGWLIVVVYLELYSAGMAIFARKRGMKRPALCLIPFVSFFFVDKQLGGFTVLSIKVKSLGKLALKLFVISLAACLYAAWGSAHLSEKNIEPLRQIMWVPVSFCILIGWLTVARSAGELLWRNGGSFKGDRLLCALLLPVPFVLAFFKERAVAEARLNA